MSNRTRVSSALPTVLVLVVTFGCLFAPVQAWAQAGLADTLGTQAAQGELAGQRLDNNDREENQNPQQAANRPQAASTAPADGESFAQQAETLTLDIPLLINLGLMVVVFWFWVKAGDWVNKDAQKYKLGVHKWNPILFFPFVAITFLLFFLPLAIVIRTPVMFTIFLFSWVPYVLVHNKRVEPHQTVLTGSWWRYVFASILSSVGIKVSAERKAEYEKGAPVELLAMGAEDLTTNNANLLSARNSPGYIVLKDVIYDMIHRRSDKIMFDFTKQGVSVRHEIDGVWHSGEPRERESSDVMLAVIKTLKDRRSKQEGQFGAKFEGKSYLCFVVTQGVSTGERVVISRRGEEQQFSSYSELGMREGLRKKWAEIMASEVGLVIFSSMPGGGLTTMMNVSLEETDRLMRDFVAIEDVQNREHEIQNISVTTFDSAKGETPATILPRLIRKYPNVYVVRDLTDVESAKILFKEIRDEHLVITSIRAKEAAEALLRFLQLKFPQKDFAAVAKAVLYQRLVRKLCPDCKVGYTPTADALRKLGIPPGKVEKLYRPPKPEEVEKPCKTCLGIGYRGRTGIFELLVVTDQIREILVKQPKLELLKKAARASHQRSLQEEGILLVAQGVTSLAEVSRVLKQ